MKKSMYTAAQEMIEMHIKRLLALLLALLTLCLTACGGLDEAAELLDEVLEEEQTQSLPDDDRLPAYGQYYYDVENVVLYLEAYGELPPNYITKGEARELGWEGGSVEDYMDGAAIGGDTFGNREGLLPEKSGRHYTECDIDTDGYGSRGARRLIFSDDGLYFYTTDHYSSFREVTVTDDWEVRW